jgi:hypothetical protein
VSFNLPFEFCTCKHGRSWKLWKAVALSPERQVQGAAKWLANWRIKGPKNIDLSSKIKVLNYRSK